MKKSLLTLFILLATLAASAQNPSSSLFDGAWDWSYYSMLPSSKGYHTAKAYFETINETTGEITINFKGSYLVNAVYDAEAGTLTIPANQYVGHNDQYNMDMYFMHFVSTESGRVKTDDPFVASYEAFRFYFSTKDYIAIGDETKGYMDYANENSLAKVVQNSIELPEEGWSHAYIGEFYDGLHASSFTDIENHPYEVEVEGQEDNPYLFRIVNPFGPNSVVSLAGKNKDYTGQGYMYFNIEDPEFVLVYPTVYAGYKEFDEYESHDYNLEGKYFLMHELTKEQILNQGLLAEPASTYDAATKKVTFNNLYFGVPYDMLGDYRFYPLDYDPDTTGPISFQGWLQDKNGSGMCITAPEMEGEETFYNLQGQKIAAPAPGQPAIRIRAGKSEKMIK